MGLVDLCQETSTAPYDVLKVTYVRVLPTLIEMLLVIRARAAWTVNFCPKHLGTNQSEARLAKGMYT